MPLRKFRRGQTWYLRGSVRGNDVYETTGTDDAEAAEAIRIKRENELLDASVFGKRAVTPFAAAALIYLEQGGDPRFVGQYDESTGQWNGLIGYFGQTKLSSIGQIELDRAAIALYPRASAETRNRQVYTPFIAIWKKAEVRQLCDVRRWERPRMRRKSRKRWAKVVEVERMLAHAADHLRPLIIFLVYTGARMSEALYVDWSDTDLEAGWVVFRGTKRNGEDRGVPLHKNVVNALNGLSPKTGKVFLTQRGKPYSWNEKRAGGQVKTAWRGMLRRAGVTGVTPHTLRHTFSTYLTAKGVSERIRDELMGHASTETGDIYAHVPRPDLIAAVGQLPHIRAEPVQAAAAKVQNTRKVRKLG